MNIANGFTGFPPQTFTFLSDIARNNTREWFAEHRTEYERCYVEPALVFISALGPRLQQFAPGTKFEARVSGSLLRIYRDLRFSADKTPYNTDLDMWFWLGDAKGYDAPGFFFRMDPHRLILGTGMHHFPKDMLDAYRQAVVDPAKGAALSGVMADLKSAGYDVSGATRKTVPRGFDPRHERAGLLLHEALFAGYEGPVPREAATPGFIDFCASHFKALWPLSRWMVSALG